MVNLWKGKEKLVLKLVRPWFIERVARETARGVIVVSALACGCSM